jgi:hypothetical protein
VNMMYDEYVAKIQKVVAVKHGIYRFRILILSSTAAILATTGGLVGTKGLVTDETTLSASYVYGEGFHYQSKAFLGETSYEFASQDQDLWTSEEPSIPGKYKMRAKASNSFSSFYYGKEQLFEILPKPITVAVKEDTIVYGTSPTAYVVEGLAKQDVLLGNYAFTYSDKTLTEWEITPELSSLTIQDDSGKDTTAYYAITVQTKSVQITPINLTISTASATKTYDGTPLTNPGYSLVSGALLSGDHLALKTSASLTEAGTLLNQEDFTITNEDGLDMSKHYLITLQAGNLLVNKRPLSLSGQNHSYTYDGTDKSPALADISIAPETSLAEGESISYAYLDNASLLRAGEYENRFKATITKDGKDVTNNYDISYAFGKTSIAKRLLKVQAASGTKTYDGDPLHEEGYTLSEGSLADKDEVSALKAPSYTDEGDYSNDLSFDIVDKTSKESFLSSYDVSFASGTLSIAKRDLTVALTSKSVVYDGLPHQNDYAISQGSLAGHDALKVLKNPEFIASGVYDNTDFDLDVVTEEGTSNLKNYTLSIEGRTGAMRIEKRSLTLSLLPQSKTYDGKPFSKTMDATAERYSIKTGTLAPNEYIHFGYSNDPSDKGIYPIESTLSIYHQKGDAPDLSVDEDVTNNYNLTLENADFTVSARSLIITTLDAEHVYNHDPALEKDTALYTLGGDGLAEGQTLAALSISCSGLNVGSYSYQIDQASLKIVDAEKNDVTSNYDVTFVNSGKLKITPRDYSVTMNDDSHIYDGKSYSFTSYSATNLLEGDYLGFSGNAALTHVREGTVSNHPTSVSVFTASGEDVTANYNLTSLTEGQVHIEPRKITLTSADAQKEFDGYPVGATEVTVSVNPLADGDKLVVKNQASAKMVNVSDSGTNSFDYAIVNANGENVEDDYDVTKVYGKVTITPCQLSIQTADYTATYDGTNHNVSSSFLAVTSTSYPAYLTSGKVPDNYIFYQSINPPQDPILAGEYNFSGWYYLDHTGGSVDYNNFSITVTYGKTTIQKRPITIQSLGGEKRYDSVAFENKVWISSGSLAANETIAYATIAEKDKLVAKCANVDNPIGTPTITNAKGEDVTANYAITYIYGKVTIY